MTVDNVGLRRNHVHRHADITDFGEHIEGRLKNLSVPAMVTLAARAAGHRLRTCLAACHAQAIPASSGTD
jgi:hypothetical protein